LRFQPLPLAESVGWAGWIQDVAAFSSSPQLQLHHHHAPLSRRLASLPAITARLCCYQPQATSPSRPVANRLPPVLVSERREPNKSSSSGGGSRQLYASGQAHREVPLDSNSVPIQAILFRRKRNPPSRFSRISVRQTCSWSLFGNEPAPTRWTGLGHTARMTTNGCFEENYDLDMRIKIIRAYLVCSLIGQR
jgi:hypothetical protein